MNSNDSSAGFYGIRKRLGDVWHRFQHRRIQKAIQSYDVDRHFLSPVFHPVAGPATMRMVNGEIERNKLPFHTDTERPWIMRAAALRPLHVAHTDERSELPASLRTNRSPIATEDESSIILST